MTLQFSKLAVIVVRMALCIMCARENTVFIKALITRRCVSPFCLCRGKRDRREYRGRCSHHVWFAFSSCLPSKHLNSSQADKLQEIQRASKLHVGQGQNHSGGWYHVIIRKEKSIMQYTIIHIFSSYHAVSSSILLFNLKMNKGLWCTCIGVHTGLHVLKVLNYILILSLY